MFIRKVAKRCAVAGVLFVIFLTSMLSSVQAATLDSASIRLDRNKSATPPGNILILAETDQSVTETAVKLSVPSAWGVSASAGSFTVSTTGLPAGVTAWPGISTATSITGQTITFPSSDLTSGTTYGFFVTGGIGQNPTVSSQTNYQWSITTVVSGVDNSTATFGVPVTTNDQIAISASVIPDSTYYSATISATTANTTVNQNTQLDFTITYGMTYTATSPMTLQASWDLGSISGDTGNTPDLLNYVVGSATDAYGGTTPVINTTNRTITWTIPSLPANTTDQTVTFSLKTNSNYTGGSTVDLATHSRITYPTSTTDSTVHHTYQYYSSATPTPTAAPTSTAVPQQTSIPKLSCNAHCTENDQCDSGFCFIEEQRCRLQDTPHDDHCATPTNIPTVTLTPTPTPQLDNIQITDITDTSATIQATLQPSGTLLVRFGTDPQNLSSELASPQSSRHHSLTLDHLVPDTLYYFQFYSLDGKSSFSDMFSVHTALEAEDLTPQNVIITSQGIPLFQTVNIQRQQGFVIPQNTALEATLFFLDNTHFDDNLYLFAENAQHDRVTLGSLVPGISGTLSSKIRSLNINDQYTLKAHLTSATGELKEFVLASMTVITPLTVTDYQTHLPLEHVSVRIWQYDEVHQLYKLLPAPSYLPQNPMFTLNDGIIPFTFPRGKYKLELSLPGYIPQEHVLQITDSLHDLGGNIELRAIGWNPIRLAEYYWQSLSMAFNKILDESAYFGKSRALFESSAIGSLIILSTLTVLSLQAKTLSSFSSLLSHFLKHSSSVLGLSDQKTLLGQLTDNGTQRPIAQASLSVFSQKDHRLLYQTKTDRQGRYHLPKLVDPFLVTVEAIGYQAQNEIDVLKKGGLQISMDKHPTMVKRLSQTVLDFVVWGFGLGFETFLIGSFVTQFIFVKHLGLLPVTPFMMISGLNTVLWGHHLILRMRW